MLSSFYRVAYNEELGRGASGQVYVGYRKSDNVKSAVKIIFKKNMTESLVRSVTNEIRALKKLDHPNVVNLFDMYEDRVSYYICMELIAGGELFTRIEEKTSYEEAEARRLCVHILEGLKHCHDRNIVHRDLKPENFMMVNRDDDSAVKIVDFGFATEATDNSLVGILGTPMYMSPEMWLEIPHGKPTDMWSFGVLAYIILCGYPPFSDERRDRLVKRIVKSVYAYHTEYWSMISEDAKDFITRLLTVDMSERMTVDQALAHSWVLFLSSLLTLELI